jgi:hypothetical protein
VARKIVFLVVRLANLLVVVGGGLAAAVAFVALITAATVVATVVATAATAAALVKVGLPLNPLNLLVRNEVLRQSVNQSLQWRDVLDVCAVK